MTTQNNLKEEHINSNANTEKNQSKGFKKWLKRFGVVGFWFFFIKGLLWIVVVVAAYYGFKLW